MYMVSHRKAQLFEKENFKKKPLFLNLSFDGGVDSIQLF